MIQHVMLFWFKKDADPCIVATVLDGITNFIDIPSVQSVAMSENRGDPLRSAPFTHAAILTFHGIPDRDAFFVDERHVTLRDLAMTVFGDLKTISVQSSVDHAGACP